MTRAMRCTIQTGVAIVVLLAAYTAARADECRPPPTVTDGARVADADTHRLLIEIMNVLAQMHAEQLRHNGSAP